MFRPLFLLSLCQRLQVFINIPLCISLAAAAQIYDFKPQLRASQSAFHIHSCPYSYRTFLSLTHVSTHLPISFLGGQKFLLFWDCRWYQKANQYRRSSLKCPCFLASRVLLLTRSHSNLWRLLIWTRYTSRQVNFIQCEVFLSNSSHPSLLWLWGSL